MQWNDHSRIEGQHATFSASKYSWLNYTDDKLVTVYDNMKAKERGTVLHAFAATCIRLGQKLPRSHKTLNQYVNDAIGFRMDPEVLLYYSDDFFGTADTIAFRDNLLRIHDYKSGEIEAHMEQLLIYDALFCLEYAVSPYEIDHELRIYQNDDVNIYNPTGQEIMDICDKIIRFNKLLIQHRKQEV